MARRAGVRSIAVTYALCRSPAGAVAPTWVAHSFPEAVRIARDSVNVESPMTIAARTRHRRDAQTFSPDSDGLIERSSARSRGREAVAAHTFGERAQRMSAPGAPRAAQDALAR